jgi:DNA polymerase III delta prime subunit
MEYSINQKSQNQDNVSSIPWVEKYRPVEFNEIILDSSNKLIFQNVLTLNSFPNLLFYGPPGTGKTTTIINLIKSYQDKYSFISEDQILHLNASDERGIEIIRNQIYGFVKSSGLFNNSLKFVILDEIDYMTKNAQLALRYLIKDRSLNVRYILICNYISRIDETLQNDFVQLRFNQLPVNSIINHISNIAIKENLILSTEQIINIQKIFNSDIRSMINYLQSNSLNFKTNNPNNNVNLPENIFKALINEIKVSGTTKNIFLNSLDLTKYIKHLHISNCIFIKLFLNYLYKNHLVLINNESIQLLELITYSPNNINLIEPQINNSLNILKHILFKYLIIDNL